VSPVDWVGVVSLLYLLLACALQYRYINNIEYSCPEQELRGHQPFCVQEASGRQRESLGGCARIHLDIADAWVGGVHLLHLLACALQHRYLNNIADNYLKAA
jgi:hypothetical protein